MSPVNRAIRPYLLRTCHISYAFPTPIFLSMKYTISTKRAAKIALSEPHSFLITFVISTRYNPSGRLPNHPLNRTLPPRVSAFASPSCSFTNSAVVAAPVSSVVRLQRNA